MGTGERATARAGEVANASRWSSLFVILAAVVLIDQATKQLVRSALDPGEQGVFLGRISVHHVQNTGIAGGGLQGNAVPFALLGILAVVWIYAYLARRAGPRPWLLTGFGLVLGGGLGNLIDRVRLGWVTDFIRQEDRAYNLADIAIFLGGGIVLIVLIGSLGQVRRPRAGDGAADA